MKTMLLVVLISAACKSGKPAEAPGDAGRKGPETVVELTPQGMETGEVRTARLEAGAFKPRLVTSALIAADSQAFARVGARVAGRVVAIHVGAGAQVEAGQPLIEVETAELHQVSTDFLTAIARSRNAGEVLARQKQLVDERVGALKDLHRAEADAAVARVTLREAEEHLHFLGLSSESIRALRAGNLTAADHSVVRAPIGGRVASVTASLGQVLTGIEDLVTVVKSDKLWAVMQIYESDLARIAIGAPVTLELTAAPGKAIEGRISSIGAVVDAVSRSVEARADLPNADGTLKPGMTGTAAIAVRSDGATLWAPAEAVQSHGGDRVVFVRVGERRFEARHVQIGPEQGGFVPVRGVPEGTEMVIHGAFGLRGELERSALEGD
jgi:cobalt-zinc-cadmium efflux system membrane fusion protein